MFYYIYKHLIMTYFSAKTINRFPVPFDTPLSDDEKQQLKNDLPHLSVSCSTCDIIYQFNGIFNHGLETISGMTSEQLFEHYAYFVNLSWLDTKYDTEDCRKNTELKLIVCPMCVKTLCSLNVQGIL